jgi:D-alanyl-lipoteichoic acid acyltransferase DltB (MBOAT superfamily)
LFFNSVEFFYFFVITTALYFAVPFRYRWLMLLVTGCFFYMFWKSFGFWYYIFVIGAETFINYGCALGIARTENVKTRKYYLAAAAVGTIGMLFFFKYYNFVNESFRAVFGYLGFAYDLPHLSIELPLGISFHSFQTLGYTIDVYRRKSKPETHAGYFSLYTVFYPQLIAGPIERANHLLGQLRQKNAFDVERLSAGLKMMLWGLFKKAVIADRLSVFVNLIYGDPGNYSGATLLLATYCYAFQIYCDFSGYSDMAIGAAKILGVDLMQNFRLPYLAKSIPEFWSRWHISLTTWFKDYLYIPLGGNRVSVSRWTFNIMVVFLVSGLWHGANWTFVIWGGLHGLYYLGGRATASVRETIWKALAVPAAMSNAFKVAVTFHLVLLSWVFFRANSLSDALYIIGRIGSDLTGRLYTGPSQLQTAISLAFVLLLVLVQVLQEKGRISLYGSGSRVPAYLRAPAYVLMVFAILIFGVSNNAFIYFQF